MQTNVRIVNKFREVGGSWIVAPDDAKMAYVKKQLETYQAEEKDSDWHLETRGEVADWHRWA
jgi:hypothetical protein